MCEIWWWEPNALRVTQIHSAVAVVRFVCLSQQSVIGIFWHAETLLDILGSLSSN